MKITFSENIGSTPAIVNRDTGEIVLKPSIWFKLPEAYRRFILAHEIGHYVRQTTNELEADHYAFHQLAGTFPESLKNTVRTLFEVLPFTSELQGIRLQNMYRLALTYDQAQNPTPERLTEIKRIESDLIKNSDHFQILQYMTSTPKGSPTDYHFPGYDPSIFDPSVGRWFRDVPINPGEYLNAKQEPVIFKPNTTLDIDKKTVTEVNLTSGSVSLNSLPAYQLPLKIDLKTAALVILVILALIGLSKL